MKIDKVITFDKDITRDILTIVGYAVGDDDYIVDENWDRVLATDGKHIQIGEVAGVHKCGIIRNDIVSLIKLADRLEEKEK